MKRKYIGWDKRDRHGREIHEGDIVDVIFYTHSCFGGSYEHIVRAVVVWDTKSASWAFEYKVPAEGVIWDKEKNKWKYADTYIPERVAIPNISVREEGILVVGNIYDNPELLNEKPRLKSGYKEI